MAIAVPPSPVSSAGWLAGGRRGEVDGQSGAAGRVLVGVLTTTCVAAGLGAGDPRLGAVAALFGVLGFGLRGSLGPMLHYFVLWIPLRGVDLWGAPSWAVVLFFLSVVAITSLMRPRHHTIPLLARGWFIVLGILIVELAVRPARSALGDYLMSETFFLISVYGALVTYRPKSARNAQRWALAGLVLITSVLSWRYFSASAVLQSIAVGQRPGIVLGEISSNYLSVVAGASAIACLALLGRSSGPRVIWGAAGFAGFLAVVMVVQTRSTVLAMALLIPVMAILGARRERWRVVLVVVALVAFASQLFLSSGLQMRMERLGEDEGNGRSAIYLYALQRIAHSPFIGSGVARFGEELSEEWGVHYAHNIVLENMGRFGMLAGLLTVLLWVAPLARVLRTPAGSAATFIALNSLFEPALETQMWGALYISLVVAGLWEIETRNLAGANYNRHSGVSFEEARSRGLSQVSP